MKVRFLGKLSNKNSAGCSSCGHATKSYSVLVKTKKVAMPSGRIQFWQKGQVINVSDSDGLYLLDLMYSANGRLHNMFEVGE